ncbi:Calcineurin-like phosphoesterase [Rhizobiales bacterium GAS191]|nr:Calcineurin-like phosphoesterase [Rhizobiales bacterium GAS191]
MKLILVSDTHLARRAACCCDNWNIVAKAIRHERPDGVVHLGDICADGVGTDGELEDAAALFTDLGAPIRFLPGNHDIGGNPLERGASSEHPLELGRLAEYRRLFGADHWAFEAEGWQVIGLDAQLFNTATDEEEAQFAWLERELRAHAGPLGLMLHKPLFRHGPADTESHIRFVPATARRRLLSLAAGRDLRFVVSGHVHQARRLEVEGVEHVWAPSTAFCIPDAMQERIGEKRVGMLRLELTAAEHRFEDVLPAGLVRHNLLDYPEVYPEIAAIRARLGESAAL